MNDEIIKLITGSSNKVSYSLPVEKEDKVCIIAPHPDDETLGCGGVIKKMLNKGIQVELILVTDGSSGGKADNLADIRIGEFHQAKEILGITKLYYLGYKDGQLDQYYLPLMKSLNEILGVMNPKVIFIPYIFDYSIDHLITYKASIETLKSFTHIEAFMYEVWTPILNPDYFVDVHNEYEIKKTAMKCYKSQEKYFGIMDKTETLNRFRACLSIIYKEGYVECFKKITKEYRDEYVGR